MKKLLYALLCLLILPRPEFCAPFGQYYIPSDGSTLSIERQENGTISTNLSLFRLTAQDNGVGEYRNGVLTVTAADAAGNPMIWEITRVESGLKAVVVDSSWKLLPEGSEFSFIPMPESGDQ